MQGPGNMGERAIALFLLAFLAFNPPLLSIFSADLVIFGVPLLYLYLFGVWGLIIAMIGLQAAAARRLRDRSRAPLPGDDRARGS